MRKIIFLLAFSILSTFAYPLKCSTTEQQLMTLEAQIFHQGHWHEGYITYTKTQNGYELEQYKFDIVSTLNGQCNGYFHESEKFTPLNPNNDFAKDYNFIHIY